MRLVIAALASVIATLSGALSYAQAPAPPRASTREPVTLNFTDAEIEAVARTMASLIGRDIVIDPRVKGTISLSTEQPVTPQAAYQHVLALLRLSGFAVVDANGLLKVVPEADAKLQGGPVSVGATPTGHQLVTQIFRLQHESANSLVPVLRPLISPNNTLSVSPGTNSLVITDYADNLQRLGRIISALDLSPVAEVEVLPLQHTLAADLAPVVQRLAEASGGVAGLTGATVATSAMSLGDAATRTTVIAEVRSNALLVRAPSAARLNLIRSLVQRLDQPASASPMGNIHVVYLKNADATRLAVTLRAALAGMGGTGSAGLLPATAGMTTVGGTSMVPTSAGPGLTPATGAMQATAAPSTGGQIQADPAANALVITAPEPQYRQLRAVIERLDTRRAQVFVESLIAEVNADKAAEFGIQWQNVIGNTNNPNFGVAGTNFTAGGANIIGLNLGAATGNPLPSPGLNLGVVRQVQGAYLLSALARFLETNADGNVLSTPTLLTLDNEEARIVIGQNVPFVTGQYTNANTSGTGSVNPFQTIERRDVGLTLRVRPQISENGTVKLQIFQEVSSVQAGSVNSPSGLITNKRSIESTVLVDDGAIVVLGGLLQDEYAGNEQKVTGIGDVPLLGRLFKSETRSRRKTNLMVFLRPVVVRDARQSDELTLDRYELMRLKQQAAQPAPSAVTPINQAPVLPPVVAPTVAPVPNRP